MFALLTNSNYGSFIVKALEYPPSNMFCGLVNPTPKDKKLEARVIQLCESVYRIDNFILAEVRNAWREVYALTNMTYTHLKPEYCVIMFAKLDAILQYFNKKWIVLGKPEPQLKAYIDEIHLFIKNEKPLFTMINEILLNTDLSLYAPLYKETIKSETSRLAEIEGKNK